MVQVTLSEKNDRSNGHFIVFSLPEQTGVKNDLVWRCVHLDMMGCPEICQRCTKVAVKALIVFYLHQ